MSYNGFMPLLVNIEYIDLLLEKLSRKSGHSRDRYGFGKMSEEIGSSVITQKYLYENLDGRLQKLKREGKKQVSLTPNRLDELAQYLGLQGFGEFVKRLENPIDPVLASCVGSYYSYVRRSAKEGVVYQSPVVIREENNEIQLTLKGPAMTYGGKLMLRHGCLFCLMESKEGKAFHHIYKIGQRHQPHVLLGVFSGVSTAYHPIGGRVVLIRKDEKFEHLHNEELPIQALRASSNAIHQKLAHYFESFEKNNIKVNTPITFGLDELTNEG